MKEIRYASVLPIILVIFASSAAFAGTPWASSRWTAVVRQLDSLHDRTTRIRGIEHRGEAAVSVEVTCVDHNLKTGAIKKVAGKGQASMAQDDFEGDVLGVGTFGIDSPGGEKLQWFENTGAACAAGPVAWTKG